MDGFSSRPFILLYFLAFFLFDYQSKSFKKLLFVTPIVKLGPRCRQFSPTFPFLLVAEGPE